MTDAAPTLSTSALARKLGKPAKQMFAELAALGWIKRDGETWVLTPKGVFEGGTYHESKRFGTYVVWPDTVAEHPALVTPDSQLLSATALGKQVGLSAVTLNRVLHELGWIEPHTRGWRLTSAGKRQGGRQSEDARSGVPYALWPSTLNSSPALGRRLEAIAPTEGEDEVAEKGYSCLDGHQVQNEAERRIDNWLYLAGVVHAYKQPLPIDEVHVLCDFHIPAAGLYIEYWAADGDARYLADKMRKKELYDRYGLAMIELEGSDLDDLEESLARRLLKRGIETL